MNELTFRRFNTGIFHQTATAVIMFTLYRFYRDDGTSLTAALFYSLIKWVLATKELNRLYIAYLER